MRVHCSTSKGRRERIHAFVMHSYYLRKIGHTIELWRVEGKGFIPSLFAHVHRNKALSHREKILRLKEIWAQEVHYVYKELRNRFNQQDLMLRWGGEWSVRLYNYCLMHYRRWRVSRMWKFSCMRQWINTCKKKIEREHQQKNCKRSDWQQAKKYLTVKWWKEMKILSM